MNQKNENGKLSRVRGLVWKLKESSIDCVPICMYLETMVFILGCCDIRSENPRIMAGDANRPRICARGPTTLWMLVQKVSRCVHFRARSINQDSQRPSLQSWSWLGRRWSTGLFISQRGVLEESQGYARMTSPANGHHANTAWLFQELDVLKLLRDEC